MMFSPMTCAIDRYALSPRSHPDSNRCAAMALSLLMLALAGAPATSQVAGAVLDANTLTPIGGALVTLQATTQQVTTAADGSFFLPGVSGTNLVVVAARKGYYNTPMGVTAPGAATIFMMEPIVVGNNLSYSFMDPAACGTCHPDQYAQWVGSPMADAGPNTWVYDIYNGTGTPGGIGGFVYTTSSPHAATNPNSECASCHQPEPWIKQPFSALEPITNLSPQAAHGISCEVCHKIAHIDENSTNYPGIYPGEVSFNLPDSPLVIHQTQYGVLADTSFQALGIMRPAYQPQLAAAVCAACHQDKNDPDGNGNFEEPNGVISEPTYGEWLASPYGDPTSPLYKSCVECHMPSYGATSVSNFTSLQRDPATIRSHAILGTTPEFLENAVDMAINVQNVGSSIQATVTITNSLTGHHVPTGVTVRNMILLVEAWSTSDGQKLNYTGTEFIHNLGGVGDPNQGYFAGLPGRFFAKVNHDAAGNGPTFFTDATGILWDTRIPALGVDTSNYSFDVPPGTGQVMLRARLVYRRAFRAFVDAKQWTMDGHGNPLEDIAAPYFGHLMEESTWTSAGTGGVVPFGGSCAGLVASAVNTPSIGSTNFMPTLTGAQPFVPTMLVAGFSNTSWLGSPLPLDMGPFGAPGCFLLVSPDGFAASLANAAGDSSVPLHFPFLPALVGGVAYVQWGAQDLTNSLGWSFSNGLILTLQP